MKIIALEEHFVDPAVSRAAAPAATALSPDFGTAYAPASGLPYSPPGEVLMDLAEGRIADMDAGGITMQVLSCLGPQQVPPDVAPEVVRAANDRSAAAVRAYPDRFAAFAALPTAVPGAAADELDRCVGELGFVGTMILGRTDGEFLDAPRFDPILAKAAALDVPIFLHPGVPPRTITESDYLGGLSPVVATRLQTSAWGWHQETAVHFLHLVHSGTFDRYPELQIILGHWGEMIPFYLDRINEALPQRATKLERSFEEYFRQNVHIAPSGMFSQAQLRFCLEVVGLERIVFAVDYPFIGNEGVLPFFEQADLPQEAKHKIAHENAERLLRL
ncbi:amidohydrolase family protein [Actinomadura opuntiae]|uniref:amidohydrolase family protein n=1 Tax=Actinomadura sp. OS1-43 TaxID=604315 RepID=UPI00255B3769|nr:amidohydrolase family protein [Actinomadura sp. OS1-43]MDL4813274.1 amidohydrolase family protein [Actinomadura sp. OS1-43]